jgi:hypothetical protein
MLLQVSVAICSTSNLFDKFNLIEFNDLVLISHSVSEMPVESVNTRKGK